MYCCGTSGPGIVVDANWHAPPIQTPLQPFMAKIFPNGRGPLSRTMCPDTPQKSLSGGHDKVLKASTWPPNSSNPYQIEFARNTVTVPCGKLHSLLTVPPYCRTVCHDKPQKLLRNGQKDVTKTSRCQPGLSILQIWIKSSIYKTSQYRSDHSGPTFNSLDSKDPLQMPWCQTPQANPQGSCVYASMGQGQIRSTVGPPWIWLVWAHPTDAQFGSHAHVLTSRSHSMRSSSVWQGTLSC